jgi:inorganic pyrophosphatase
VTVDLSNLGAFDDYADGEMIVRVVIETPKGSRNKFTYDPRLRLFQLTGVLPAGHAYPFDYGMIPGTRGDDGDPLDALVLMDEPAFCGCLVPCRLIGAIEAEQTERDGKTERNDRLIAVASKSREWEDVRDVSDLSRNLLDEIAHFFVSFNDAKGKKFEVTARRGAKAALRLVKAGVRAAGTNV